MPCPPPVLQLGARLQPFHRYWKVGGAIFLDDYISKGWLPGPAESQESKFWQEALKRFPSQTEEEVTSFLKSYSWGQKFGLCALVPNQIWETRVSWEAEKDCFIALPGKGGHSGFMALRTACTNLVGSGKELYSSGSSMRLLIRLGGVQGTTPLF